MTTPLTVCDDPAGVRLRYTPDNPVMLYTDFAPDVGGGANVIINGLLTADEKRSVVRVSPAPPTNPAALGDQPFVTLRHGSYGRSGGRSRSWLRDTVQYAGSLAEEVAELAHERNAGRVWVVLHHSGVPVGYRLAVRHRIPIHAGVNDDPPYAVALRSRQAFILVPWVSWIFGATLRAAASIDTTSPPMADRYRRKYGVDSVVTHRGLTGPLVPRSTFSRDYGELTVGVLGNSYSYTQLPLLGQAVAAAAARSGARGRIVVFGQGQGDRLRADLSPLGVTVDILGHVPESAAVERLGGCLALYLNYPFGWRDRVLARTSFPVKLSTYLLATRPILFHGPVETSITGPMATSGGGILHWPNSDPAVGAEILARIWADPAADEPWVGEAVRAAFYDYDTYRQNLIGALNRPV